MVAQNTVRTYGLNHAFGYIERVVKSDFFSQKRPILLHKCATKSELPSYIRTRLCTMVWSRVFFVKISWETNLLDFIQL